MTTTETTYTPGPWTVSHRTTNGYGQFNITDATGRSIGGA